MAKTTIPAGGITDGTLTSAKLDQDGAFTFNEDSADADFRVESNGNANMLFVSGGNDVVGVGAEGDLGAGLHIKTADSGASVQSTADELVIEGSGDSGMVILSGNSSNGAIYFGDDGDNDVGGIDYDHNGDIFKIIAGGSAIVDFISSGVVFNESSADQDFRVESNGNTHAIFVNAGDDNVLFLNSAGGTANAHFGIASNAKVTNSRDGGTPIEVNRNTNDGNLVDLRQGGTVQGTISVSGSTVGYNTFMGSHWSQLADNSKPTILRGTVLETIADMCVWYTVKFDRNQHNDKDTEYHYEEYELPSGKKVGDTVSITHADDISYSGVIEKESNLTLPKFKISDTEESKAVYGVFHTWDDDDDGKNWQNDASIASLGTYMIRIHKDETVAIGDYIQSKGDGTGKKQADDILRASTIGKVTSTEKVITHGDGSYCVPCTLHCG
jgi:hypothetical protein|tara:strand:+ start:740 stop:2062 length:1323 start_codon:yes stop_codon:yes gene_type:complete